MLSAAVIGLGRAVGDALLPAMLAGNAIRFAKTPLDSLRTLTSHISLVLSSDIGGGEHFRCCWPARCFCCFARRCR